MLQKGENLMSMSNREYLYQKRDILYAYPKEALQSPVVAMERFHQEAEYLYRWCTADKAELSEVGFNLRLLEDLPARTGASRQSQEDWFASRFISRDAMLEWIRISRVASDFRDRLLSAFLYAFRDTKDLLRRIREIAKGDEDVTMLSDLECLIALGRKNSGLLSAIRFNLVLLDDVDFLAQKMDDLFSRTSNSTPVEFERKRLRDAAYTHLKEATDQIRACGRYVFRRNAERLRGYGSSLPFGVGDDRLEDKLVQYKAVKASVMMMG
jgi:hypothetical protein